LHGAAAEVAGLISTDDPMLDVRGRAAEREGY